MQFAVYKQGSAASPLFTGSKSACLRFMAHALRSFNVLVIAKLGS